MTDTRSTTFSKRLASDRQRVEERCKDLLARLVDPAGGVGAAMEYMLLGGGKRLRPVLCLWAHDAFGGTVHEACLDAACAVECIHTYSLIHDDLPCMDDDDMRRGRASCHRRFGEAMAVLTGDALLTLAFEIVARLPEQRGVRADATVTLSAVLARAAGTHGLITGQALDLENVNGEEAVERVDMIHRRKTGSLIAAAMESGAIMAGCDPEGRTMARRAGETAGRAFQIIDDVLDIEMDSAALGKTSGKDEQCGKMTYPSLVGVDRARNDARRLLGEARDALPGGGAVAPLRWLLETLVERDR